MQTKELQGFLLINKPKNITSFDCIRHIKNIFGATKIKIGHAGTLDPFATGLLIIALTRQATKHISVLMKLDKEYLAKAKLGELTDTLDKTGTITQTEAIENISEQKLIEAINDLEDEYLQTPPAFAALKYRGKPLYALARQKKLPNETLSDILQQKKRKVQLHALELLNFEPPFFTLKAHVSHGTYIRSLMNNIARQIETCATTYELERTKIGPFDLQEAHPLLDLKTKECVMIRLISISNCMKQIKKWFSGTVG